AGQERLVEAFVEFEVEDAEAEPRELVELVDRARVTDRVVPFGQLGGRDRGWKGRVARELERLGRSRRWKCGHARILAWNDGAPRDAKVTPERRSGLSASRSDDVGSCTHSTCDELSTGFH